MGVHSLRFRAARYTVVVPRPACGGLGAGRPGTPYPPLPLDEGSPRQRDSGAVTYMTILEDILKDPRLDSEIRRILEENIAFAKGGVNGPDMFYANVTSRFGNMTHYCSPGDLAPKILEVARQEEDACFLPISALS